MLGSSHLDVAVVAHGVEVCLDPAVHAEGRGGAVRHQGVGGVGAGQAWGGGIISYFSNCSSVFTDIRITDMGEPVPAEGGAGAVPPPPLPLVHAAPRHRGQAHPVTDHQHQVLANQG